MDEIKFTSEGGHKVCGSLAKCPGRESEVVLLFHGIFVDRNENGRFPRLARKLADISLSSLRVDLPGHGASPVKSEDVTVEMMAANVAATYRWAVHQGYTKIHIVCSSFSGALFSMIFQVIDKKYLASLHFLNPVLDFDDVFVHPGKEEMAEIFSTKRIGQLTQKGYFYPQPHFCMSDAFWSGLLSVDIPKMYRDIDISHRVFHGNADELVDFDRTRKIVQDNKSAAFIEVDGGVHAFTQSGHEENVWSNILKYLR